MCLNFGVPGMSIVWMMMKHKTVFDLDYKSK